MFCPTVYTLHIQEMTSWLYTLSGRWGSVCVESVKICLVTCEKLICMVVDCGIELPNPWWSADGQLRVFWGQRSLRLRSEAGLHEADFIWVPPRWSKGSGVDSSRHKWVYAAEETRRLWGKYYRPLRAGNYKCYNMVVNLIPSQAQ